MYGKALFSVVLVVLAAVLPYLLADNRWLADRVAWYTKATVAGTEETSKPTTWWMSLVPDVEKPAGPSVVDGPAMTMYGTIKTDLPSDDLGTTTAVHQVQSEASNPTLSPPRVVGPPSIPLEHLLSFDMTPEWISSNWSRVTTRLSDLDLQGWRVPIARGSGPQAFTGSTTYYFDLHRQVQRILLHGYTVDPSEVVNLATTRFRMHRISSRIDDLYEATVDGQVIGALNVRYSAVANRRAAKSCEILMELNRQGSNYGMTREFSSFRQESTEELELFGPKSLKTQ